MSFLAMCLHGVVCKVEVREVSAAMHGVKGGIFPRTLQAVCCCVFGMQTESWCGLLEKGGNEPTYVVASL